MTPDGQCEAFIHFGYEGNYGCTDAAQDEWLVTPEITLTDNETLSFLLQCDYSTVYTWDFTDMKFKDRSVIDNTLQVMITTDNGDNWKCIWDLEADEVRNVSDSDCYYRYGDLMYHNFSVSLSDYAGKNVKIAFRYIRTEGWTGNSMMIDGVTIEHPAGPWTLLGTGTMADGWVIPALTKNPSEFYNPADYVFDVDIFESTEKQGVYKISSPYTSAKFPFANLNGNKDVAYDIVIDASNPDFVIVEPQISGFEHNDPGTKASRYQVPYYISNAGKYYLDEGNAIEDIIAYGYASTFDIDNGIITIVKPQYGHEKGTGLDMGYDCSNTNSYTTVITLPAKTSEPTWTNIGKGIYVDGFLYSGYFGNPKGHGWEVEIQEKSDNPGLYRMKNPYTTDACPMDYFNDNTNDAYVTIDATDPEMVVMQPQYSGFSAYTNGEAWDFYIGNFAGLYVSYGYDPSVVASVLKDSEKDRLANGVITFKKPLFGRDNDYDFGYNWQDAAGVALPYPALLYLPSATVTPEEADIEASKIEFDITEINGTVGTTHKLTATVYPENTTVKKINWASSDDNVATVSADGVISFLSEGNAKITAACGMAYSTCNVTVSATSGINSIVNDVTNDGIYYTPLGIKVNGTPSHGIYIKVANGKATKVTL